MSESVFFTFPPRPVLAPFVRAIWGVRAAVVEAAEAVLPNGAIELMVNFGSEQRVVGHGERRLDEPYGRAWIAGTQDRRLVHQSPDGIDLISVSFRPGGAHPFFDLPMDELANHVVELDDVLGPRARTLHDRLAERPSDRERADTFQDWLLERRRAVHSAFPTVLRAVELLGRAEPAVSVAGTCDRLGLSHRHLIRSFRATIGLPPKTVGRIARFQGMLSAARAPRRVDWADLAARFGYCDQSHLVREVRQFASVTPTELLRHLTEQGALSIDR